MTLKQLVRIGFKISIGFIVSVFVLFWNVKTVNLDKQPVADVFPIKKISLNKVKNSKKNIFKQKLDKNTLNTNILSVKKENFLKKIVVSAINENHYASLSKNTYNTLCSYYSDWCNIIEIDDFGYQDKVYYTALVIFLLEFINKSLPIKGNIQYIKIQLDTNGRRGYAGHHTIIMNVRKNMTYKQFFEVLTHEVGHIIDLGVLEGKSWFKEKKFTEFGKVVFADNDPSLKFYRLSWLGEKTKKPTAYVVDFVSGYGMTNPFEDFAESFNMYINHNWVFIQMASESNVLKEKYNFFASLFKGKYIYSDKTFKYNSLYRPWDTTVFSN